MRELEELRDRLQGLVKQQQKEGVVRYELFDIIDELREFNGIEAARTIADALVLRDGETAMHVGLALYNLGADGRAACLEAMKDPKTAEHTGEWIRNFGNLTDTSFLKELRSSSEPEVRRAAVLALGRFGAKWEDFIDLLDDPEAAVREAVARELGRERKSYARGLQWRATRHYPSAAVNKVPDSTQRSGGCGTWRSVPLMLHALSHESNRIVVRELTDALLHLIMKFCPGDDAPANAKFVAEAILEYPVRTRERLGQGFQVDEYSDFCNRGGLPLWRPFYLALEAKEGKRHLDVIKQAFQDIEKDHFEFTHSPDIQERDARLSSALIQALARLGEMWAIECLLEVHLNAARHYHCPVAAESGCTIIGLGSPAVGPLLKILTTSRYLPEKIEAVQLLGHIDDKNARKAVKKVASIWNRNPKKLKAAARQAWQISQG